MSMSKGEELLISLFVAPLTGAVISQLVYRYFDKYHKPQQAKTREQKTREQIETEFQKAIKEAKK